MKKKFSLVVLLLLSLSLLVQTISLADSMDYSDVIVYLIDSWSPDMTRDDLVEKYGSPYSETDTYVSFWDQEEATLQTYEFSDGCLTSVQVAYGSYPKEHHGWVYSMYASTQQKVNEALGDEMGNLFFYNETGKTSEDLSCAAITWSGDTVGVLLVFNQTDTQVCIRTVITSTH